jgi:hypothetical protein
MPSTIWEWAQYKDQVMVHEEKEHFGQFVGLYSDE